MAHNNTTLDVSYDFIVQNYSKFRASAPTLKTPFLVFVSAPQGAGKTYLTNKLAERLQHANYKCLAVSIDDFYLTHNDQHKINTSIGRENPLVCGRGLPLTHDLPLLQKFMDDVFSKGPVPSTLDIPRYDKSKFDGEGDRMKEFDQFDTPVDIVLMEGWFLGFSRIEDESKITNPNMIAINRELTKYANTLWDSPLIGENNNNSCGIIIKGVDGVAIDDLVLHWRLQQEHHLIANTGHGMSDAKVVEFVSRYLPSYDLYYNGLLQMGKENDLIMNVDSNRGLVDFHTRK